MRTVLRLTIAAAVAVFAVPALAINDATDSVDIHLRDLPAGEGRVVVVPVELAASGISDATDSVDIHLRYGYVTASPVAVALASTGISDSADSVDIHLVYDRLGEGRGLRVTEGSGSGAPPEGTPQPAAYDYFDAAHGERSSPQDWDLGNRP